MGLFIFLVLVLLGIFIYLRISKSVVEVRGHWQHFFDEFNYSSDEFYQSIENSIHSKEIPDVETSRINYSEGGMFSANREYLRVQRGTIVFDICAAPFALGFFVSSWHGGLPTIMQNIIGAIPFIGGALERIYYTKTYFQMDAEQMFASAVHNVVLEEAQNITNGKGVRAMTDIEKIFQIVRK